MIGQRFGMLTVRNRSTRARGPFWLCDCDCGGIAEVRQDHLRKGDTISCKCHMRSRGLTSNLRHGKTDTRIHHIWTSMVQRCTNQRNQAYPQYGGRGIRICDRWKSFEAFIADVGEPPAGLTLDRIDNDGHYEPGNWRWATPAAQARNRSSNRVIEFRGQRRPVAEWAEVLGIDDKLVYGRLRHGWSAQRALTTPVRKQSNNRSAA